MAREQGAVCSVFLHVSLVKTGMLQDLCYARAGAPVVCQNDALLHLHEVRAGHVACARINLAVVVAPWFPRGHEAGRVDRAGVGTIVAEYAEEGVIAVYWPRCGDQTVWTRARWTESDVVVAAASAPWQPS